MPLRGFLPISLADTDAVAALQARVDSKYVVDQSTLALLLDGVLGTHHVLEIEGLRAFGYRSWYFDTADLDTYRAHVQGRRRRYKVRTRLYEDTGDCLLEVKLKGRRGETIKTRMPARCGHGELDSGCVTFVRDVLARSYGWDEIAALRRSIESAYRRVTLVDSRDGARVTIDTDLAYRRDGDDRPFGALADGKAIVECKSVSGRSVAEDVLRACGARPVDCSKYCVGVEFAFRPDRGGANARLRRLHFASADDPSRVLMGAA